MRTSLLSNILLAAFLLIFVVGCERKESPKPKAVVRAVKTYTVKKKASGQKRRFSGTVQASDVTALSFRVGGQVKKVNVKFGDSVRKGQIVSELDRKPFLLGVKKAEAELKNNIAKVNERKKNFERQAKLQKQGIVSKADYDRAKADYQSFQSSVDSSEASLNLSKKDLSYTILRAPYSGSIAKRKVEPFVTVQSGQVIFEMTREGDLEVATNVPETLIDLVKSGQEVGIALAALNVSGTPAAKKSPTLRGRVYKIGTVTEGANTFPVNVKLVNPPKNIRVGMTAEVEFIFDTYKGQSAYMIPFSAALTGSGRTTKGKARGGVVGIFVFDPSTSTVRKTLVKARNIRDNFIEINEGLKEGDIIVIAGVHFLRDGQKVKLLNEEGK